MLAEKLGEVRTRDLSEVGIPRCYLKRMCEEGLLIKVGYGRYRAVSRRAMRLGPSFVKIGKAVLYPLDELDAWDEKNKVQCRASKGLGEHRGDQA